MRGGRCDGFHDAGTVVGLEDTTLVKVALAVSDVDSVALAHAQHTHGVAALLGVEGAEIAG
jgi:hypothetical protein